MPRRHFIQTVALGLTVLASGCGTTPTPTPTPTPTLTPTLTPERWWVDDGCPEGLVIAKQFADRILKAVWCVRPPSGDLYVSLVRGPFTELHSNGVIAVTGFRCDQITRRSTMSRHDRPSKQGGTESVETFGMEYGSEICCEGTWSHWSEQGEPLKTKTWDQEACPTRHSDQLQPLVDL